MHLESNVITSVEREVEEEEVAGLGQGSCRFEYAGYSCNASSIF